MNPLHQLAERKIEEAVREGLLDNLPGRGRPLVLEDPLAACTPGEWDE